ncbi:tRNA (uracil-5-)-methyltransferase like protein A [Cyphomyrmex costatus]|uniref:tRNA (uracil(54)-C(5))-methyltransferase n=2 Tax=Cyphomyrmex costatus TaxID=456900 RepID=A0A151IHC9_9HYME|nr:tRNA (uracil-5-)-methyltransferase like protein A [Cyphomyrmex costatus]
MMECDQESNNDTTDFTADIDLDQFDGQKDVTDEDVMHHLDVIENIELDPETFCVDQCMKENNQSEFSEKEGEEQAEEKDEVTVIEEEFIEVKWYEKKLAEKNTLLKERLSKLARVLTVSYPSYEKWLERIQKIEGSPICKVDPIRRCSLKKPNTNRWKFQCKKKSIQESIKPDPDSSANTLKSVWNLEPIGIGSATAPHITEFPSFVLKAVKIFEDFLQTTISEDTVEDTSNENPSDDISMDIDTKKDVDQDKKQHWLCLLVRCNSKDELMLFATGKNISRSVMDRLKQTYEFGPGRNCNVKSLYCKSMNKRDDKIVTTFLVGAEALDETVGNLKVQLAPKTNFWCNAGGAWNVAKTVADMLEPTKKITVLEIGCGIGVIGLTIASKCREVIGVDSPSEIEEAEMTCELNNIYNVSFIMGSPSEVVIKLNSARDLYNKNRVTYCIVNAGTNIGRAIEVMTCLRKISSLRRIVMVTTLTKQSVRAILELARPIETGLGHPFMPIRACVVDTLPTGPHFEVVILMERRLMHRLTQPWFIKMLEEESKTLANTKVLEKIINNDKPENVENTWIRKNPLAKPELVEKTKALFTKKITKAVKSNPSSPVKGKLKLKRDHSPDIIEIKKMSKKKIEKVGPKPKLGQHDVTAKKKNWFHENSTLRINPLFEKKTREVKEQIDLREKLLSNRIDTDLIQKVNESREILEAAKEKLSGPSPTVDATTAKELKNVLSLVLDQTNKIQTHLPRSVWDRIAPPELESKKELDDDPLLKGRFVQETRAQDIVITTANKEYLETEDNKPKFKKYHNLAPLEPNMVMPMSKKFNKSDNRPEFPQKSFDNRNRQQNQDNSWNKNKGFDRNRWSDMGSSRKPVSPMKRQNLSFTQRAPPSDGFSSKRPLLSPPRRLSSPSKRHFSPDRSYQARNSPSHREYSQRRPMSPMRVMVSDDRERHEMSPPRRPFSPINQQMSSPRRSLQMSGRPMSPIRRHISPPRPQLSPPRRQMSSMEFDLSARQLSPERRHMSPIVRMMSPPRPRDLIPPRHQSPPMRHFSPHRGSHIRNVTPPRRQQSPPRRQQSPPRRQQSPPRRQNSPPNRFADEWDIPSRGAIEQSSTWQRSVNERPENVWRNERQPTMSGNWQAMPDNDKYRKSTNQDKSWDNRESSSHGNSWNVKQSLASMKEPWQTSDNRWPGSSRSGNSSENWNRGNESLGGRNKEPWMNTNKPRWEQPQSNDWNQGDKDDWNDLPEDARDPWGDDSNVGLNRNIDNQVPSSSNWSREVDKDPWGKSKDNWQSKSQMFPAKSLCQNSNNSNINDSRWLPLNDMNKKVSSSHTSTNWQGGTNVGSNIGTNVGWQSNYGLQAPQRSFVANLFKDRR